MDIGDGFFLGPICLQLSATLLMDIGDRFFRSNMPTTLCYITDGY